MKIFKLSMNLSGTLQMILMMRSGRKHTQHGPKSSQVINFFNFQSKNMFGASKQKSFGSFIIIDYVFLEISFSFLYNKCLDDSSN
jgi:hypothetical protein